MAVRLQATARPPGLHPLPYYYPTPPRFPLGSQQSSLSMEEGESGDTGGRHRYGRERERENGDLGVVTVDDIRSTIELGKRYDDIVEHDQSDWRPSWRPDDSVVQLAFDGFQPSVASPTEANSPADSWAAYLERESFEAQEAGEREGNRNEKSVVTGRKQDAVSSQNHSLMSPERLKSVEPVALFLSGYTEPVCELYRAFSPQTIHLVAQQMKRSVPIKDHLRGFHRHRKCFTGKEAVRWLIQSKTVKNTADAILLGKELLRRGYFHHVNYRKNFDAKSWLYRFEEDEVPFSLSRKSVMERDSGFTEDLASMRTRSLTEQEDELRDSELLVRRPSQSLRPRRGTFPPPPSTHMVL